MCAFKLVRILDTEFDVTVIMICDYYHEPTILRGLLSGAMFCYSYPLHKDEMDYLWQHAKRRERLMQEDCESEQKSTVADGNFEIYEKIMKRSLAEGDSSQIKRHKSSDLGPVEGLIMGLPSSFNWTNDAHWKYVNSVVEMGVDVVVPSDVLRSIGSPGLSVGYVNEKLQQYHLYLKGMEDLRLKKVVNSPDPSATVVEHLIVESSHASGRLIYASEGQSPVTSFLKNPQDLLNATVIKRWTGPPGVQALRIPPMAPLGTIPVPLHVLPNILRPPTATVPPSFDTAQSSIHAPSSSTAAQAPSVPGEGQGQGEQGVQFRG